MVIKRRMKLVVMMNKLIEAVSRENITVMVTMIVSGTLLRRSKQVWFTAGM